MPEEEKVKPSEKLVDIDTSGPEKDVAVEEVKEEAVVETKEEEPKITEVEKEAPVKEEAVVETKEEEPRITEVKEESKEDEKLEDYSKGVQSRISKLTRKMREAERREGAAIEYAQALESQRRQDQSRFQKMDIDYWSRFEKNVKTGMESAQKELAYSVAAASLRSASLIFLVSLEIRD